MSDLHGWWRDRPDEVYWLEVTDRPDIGANLNAPQENETGGDFWGYSLVREVRPGDLVFHYDKLSQQIMSRSRATGDVWDDQVVWAARGTYARDAGILPHPRPGWYAGLDQFASLSRPLDLEGIRSKSALVQAGYADLLNRVGAPLYFPFEGGSKRPTRPLQGYLFKLPRFFVELFPELGAGLQLGKPMSREDDVLGAVYRRADEEKSVGAIDPMEVDPAIVERGTRGHAITQNALADHVAGFGHTPRSPAANEPNFDLAWEVGHTIFVAEVKSITNRNEERQLRMGLGQILVYRHQLHALHNRPVVAVIASERRPPAGWMPLCESLGIRLVWPGAFEPLDK